MKAVKMFRKVAKITGQEIEIFYECNPELVIDISIGLTRSNGGNDEVRASITVKDKYEGGPIGYAMLCNITEHPRKSISYAIHKALDRYESDKASKNGNPEA